MLRLSFPSADIVSLSRRSCLQDQSESTRIIVNEAPISDVRTIALDW
jgi:hypothetical protein